MDRDLYELFIAIGTCHRLMKEHATGTRARLGVGKVTHLLNMHDLGDGFRLEEYVDAELSNGQAISWCLELTISVDAFTIEADVRQIQQNGQDLLAEIEDRSYTTTADCVTGIIETTRRLCSTAPL